MLPGDQLTVHFTLFSEPGTFNATGSPHENWGAAKAQRNAIYFSRDDVQSCWIMLRNPSLGLQPKLYGYTMRKGHRKHHGKIQSGRELPVSRAGTQG